MELEPTYSATSVEGMFIRGFGDRLTPALRAQLKQHGIDIDSPLQAAYPQFIWDSAVTLVVEALSPNVPASESYFDAGQLFMKGFTDTLLGKAVVQLGKLIGPERTLGRMQRNQRSTNNYSSLEIEKLGPTLFRLRAGVVPEFLPRIKVAPRFDSGAFVSGIYAEVLHLLEVRNPRVVHREINRAELRYDYELSWDA